ncbi:uncharacterized protein LOC129010218 isoform X2 [Pongo pygmaeus]|nr:ubiquinol-cytochrome-c reductase complex assembly factor 6 isoform X2 [Pongo abelii]
MQDSPITVTPFSLGAPAPPLGLSGRVEDQKTGTSLLTMPAGVPMSTYLKMLAASLLAMCAGAEVVHRYYRPDLMRNRFRRVKLISQSHIA